MFTLTEDERKVILFLAIIALLGIGAESLAKIYSPNKPIPTLTQNLGKVDLNTADKDLLISVPGIGIKLAERILEYREEKSTFSSSEELKNIKGVTGYRYDKIKDSFVIR